MMKTTNQSPRCARTASSVLRYGIVLVISAALVAAQGRITKPPGQINSKRPHVATLHSSDSTEGSRVALSSDQSLNDYEAYRRGDRFYIKIPAADVPRAEALRGRGFGDVKVQRIGDSTVVSFRLQPGTSARVEQHSNRLEVVFTVAGASPAIASNSGRTVARPATNTGANKPATGAGSNKNSNSNINQRRATVSAANKNAVDRSTPATARDARNSNLASKTGSSATPASNSGSKPAATPVSSPVPSPIAKMQATPPAQKFSSTAPTALASPTIQPTPLTTTNQSTPDRWSRLKERVHYWMLLAQLNPVPVAIGAVVLLLLIGLFLFQRRRAKGPKRVRFGVIKSGKSTIGKKTAPIIESAAESKSAPGVSPAVVAAAAIPGVMAAAPNSEKSVDEVKAAPAVSDPLPTDATRRERIAQVNEEARKLMNGGEYDQSVIGSDDRETRQLVGAELLSAIVGRNATRREHARAAFMKHGYFDDATRDLRIADSPNERAAAARRLSFVHDKEATPHLIGALGDPSPDVRRASVEALMDLRDPAAIGPLNSLMQTENDRKVPRTLLKHAIDACATVPSGEVPATANASSTPAAIPDPSSQPTQIEREVIEL
jgi:hypothetical protein